MNFDEKKKSILATIIYKRLGINQKTNYIFFYAKKQRFTRKDDYVNCNFKIPKKECKNKWVKCKNPHP